MEHVALRAHPREDMRKQKVAEIMAVERAEQDGARATVQVIRHDMFPGDGGGARLLSMVSQRTGSAG
ncbi:MAG TPA: hypothetical protein VEI25_00565 [Paraburkholderia sp.]|nr:hypothetical protein [Paraburkholderia sp.]